MVGYVTGRPCSRAVRNNIPRSFPLLPDLSLLSLPSTCCSTLYPAFSKQLPYIPDQELQEEPTLTIIGLPLIFFLMFLKESLVSMSLSVVHKELACQNN